MAGPRLQDVLGGLATGGMQAFMIHRENRQRDIDNRLAIEGRNLQRQQLTQSGDLAREGIRQQELTREATEKNRAAIQARADREFKASQERFGVTAGFTQQQIDQQERKLRLQELGQGTVTGMTASQFLDAQQKVAADLKDQFNEDVNLAFDSSFRADYAAALLRAESGQEGFAGKSQFELQAMVRAKRLAEAMVSPSLYKSRISRAGVGPELTGTSEGVARAMFHRRRPENIMFDAGEINEAAGHEIVTSADISQDSPTGTLDMEDALLALIRQGVSEDAAIKILLGAMSKRTQLRGVPFVPEKRPVERRPFERPPVATMF